MPRKQDQFDKIKRITQIGVALSSEKNLDSLLEMIVDEARLFTHADGGTLYILSDDEAALQFAIVQSESLKIRMGGASGRITWPPVPIRDENGHPNHANVSAYAAISGEVVNIPDVYHAEGFNFEGTRQFDRSTGYRSRSMLVVPMRNHENDIIGVLQLLNARDGATGRVTPFSAESQSVTESLASQAAVALTNNRLINNLETLLESFIKAVATAIDEKSPYTGGHIRRVAELTMSIALKINETREGPLASVCFDEHQLKELRLAAWLHDIGKITTPEYVIDKATKLETIFDRLALLKTRFEVLRRDNEITMLRKNLVPDKEEKSDFSFPGQELPPELLAEDYDFLVNINTGFECLSDDEIARLRSIASRKWLMGSEWRPILSEEELKNLSIRRGTITEEEKKIIDNHATVTYKMLSQLPFPKKMRHVAEYASGHHEKLDGTGYPLGLKDDRIPLQVRILTLADVFEAITARDRPYKKGKKLSEAMIIMRGMVKDRHIDADLFDLFIRERIYLDYAMRELDPLQVDQPDF
jgi:HD-GYP domain-containing protein (c-di-GMP phosphodiesterase class II)